MTYQKPEIVSAKALVAIKNSTQKGLNKHDSMSPPDTATATAYEADE